MQVIKFMKLNRRLQLINFNISCFLLSLFVGGETRFDTSQAPNLQVGQVMSPFHPQVKGREPRSGVGKRHKFERHPPNHTLKPNVTRSKFHSAKGFPSLKFVEIGSESYITESRGNFI